MLSRKYLGILLLVLFSFSLCSQELLSPLLQQSAVNFSPNADLKNPFSIAVNPAALASFQESRWGVSAEKSISIPGWIYGNGVIIVPSRYGNWGVAGGYTGLSGFSRQQLSAVHARKLSEGVSLGISMGVFAMKVKGYKSLLRPVASLGTCLELSNVVSMNLSASNVFLPPGVGQPYLSGLRLLFVLLYEPSSKTSFSIWGLNNSASSINVGASIRYQIYKRLSFSMGIAVDQRWNWVAVTIHQKRISLVLHMGWHPMLGLSNTISFLGEDDN